jgi:hypothetical protein
MALVPDGVTPREDVIARFQIAQDGKPTEAQLEFQASLRVEIAELADEINYKVEDSREKSLAITHLEEALMWAGKAIFR